MTATDAPTTLTPEEREADLDLEQLKQLGALHEQGILTDEEFAAQKAKILG